MNVCRLILLVTCCSIAWFGFELACQVIRHACKDAGEEGAVGFSLLGLTILALVGFLLAGAYHISP
jgi:hypothetical protein